MRKRGRITAGIGIAIRIVGGLLVRIRLGWKAASTFGSTRRIRSSGLTCSGWHVRQAAEREESLHQTSQIRIPNVLAGKRGRLLSYTPPPPATGPPSARHSADKSRTVRCRDGARCAACSASGRSSRTTQAACNPAFNAPTISR